MSPVSRGRKKKPKRSRNRSAPPGRPGSGPSPFGGSLGAERGPVEPAGLDADELDGFGDFEDLGDDLDDREPLDDLVADFEEVIEDDDPLPAEMAAALHVTTLWMPDAQRDRLMVDRILPDFATRPDRAALTALLALGAVGGPACRDAARTLAVRFGMHGVARPAWAGEVDQPMTLERCRVLRPGNEEDWVCWNAVFRRAGRTHAFMITGHDGHDDGAAAVAGVCEPDDLPELVRMLSESDEDLRPEAVELTPDEWVRQVRHAMDVRYRQDDEDGVFEAARMGEAFSSDDGEPPEELTYHWMATLLRAWLSRLEPVVTTHLRPERPAHPG